VNNEYEAYCLADPLFYDTPLSDVASGVYPLVKEMAPEGWQKNLEDHWAIFTPEVHDLPSQGWKIHISSSLANAERIIDVVRSYCFPRNLAFKFLQGPRVALSRNSKYAGRGGSGRPALPVARGRLDACGP
jgi:hypothetical protein